MSKKQIYVYYNKQYCIVHDCPPGLLKELTFTYKEFVKQYNKPAKIRFTPIQQYNVLSMTPVQVIQTYQGFLNRIRIWLVKNGFIPVVKDGRGNVPEPDMDKAFGFRLNQEQLFTKAIKQQLSGCIEAPTRYGKSTLLVNILRVYPNLKTVVTAPGIDLVSQLVDELEVKLPNREISGIYTGSRKKFCSDDITVASMDSLHKCDLEGTQLLVIDEPHSAVTQSRYDYISSFSNAMRFGLGATLEGRYDGMDCLIEGIIGPKLAIRTYKEAVDEGALCPIKAYILRIPFNPNDVLVKNRDRAYDRMMYKNESFAELIQELCNDVIPKEWQTLIFIDNEKQCDRLSDMIDGAEGAMAKKLPKKERQEMFDKLKTSELKRCVCSHIYSTGVTIPEIRVLVNCSGGGGGISSVQKPGRLAEIKPNKTYGYLVDVLFEPESKGKAGEKYGWQDVVRDCKSRIEVYENKGYVVEYIDDFSQLKLV
jgi:superfamily II DNA or RNA helicase